MAKLISNLKHTRSGIAFGAILLCLWGVHFCALAAGSGVPECFYPPVAPSAKGLGPAAVQATEVGATQLFWAYAQGFFSGYYVISATCQDTSANAYYFSEDAYINDLTASTVAGDSTIYAAANGGFYRSLNLGQTWQRYVPGLPTATGEVGALDSVDYNHRCLVNCLFSRAEYGGTFDTLWVGTEFGPFWRSPSVGDSLELRASLMATNADGYKPAVHDILGHPLDSQTLWTGTEDGIYMTRNAKNWKHISGGLPPSEGTTWTNDPVFAIAYDAVSDQIFIAGSKGVFYGQPRPLGTTATSEIIVAWKPLGGEVEIAADTLHPATADTLRLSVPESSLQGVSLGAGQSITVLDVSTGIYWSAFVDASVSGLYALLTDAGIFYWPSGSTAPNINYQSLDPDNLMAYAFSGIAGNTIFVEFDEDQTTFWLGTENGLLSYHLTGDLTVPYANDSLTISTSHDSLTIHKIAATGSDYYVATNQGLFRAADLSGSWGRLTSYIYNADGSDSLWADTRTVAFGGEDWIYTGGYLGGFLRSEDGQSFVPSNLGMMHRNGTLEQISLFADAFENNTPANPDTGIFGVAQEWWGTLPSNQDIDGDPRVGILFLDIDDQYYLDTGDGTYINGYYDGKNEYSQYLYSTSNLREMFYLDTDPLWINNAGAAACNQMFNLINFNQDYNEAQWLRAGLGAFTQWVAGYPVATGTITFPSQNDLTTWGDKDRNIEQLYSYLLALYLYEQVFPDSIADSEVIHTLAAVATSPYHDVSGLGRLIYETTGGTSNDSTDYTPVFAGLFNDFVMASALDISEPDFYDGQYGFDNVNVRIGVTSNNWYWPLANPTQKPPYSWQIPFWSGRATQIVDTLLFNNAYPMDTLMVNGDDQNRFNFNFLLSLTGNFTPEMPSDQVVILPVNADPISNKGMVVLPPDLRLGNGNTPPNLIRLLAVCASSSGDASSCYVLGDEASPASQFYQAISQNPIDDRYLDIYSFTNERIYPDGGQLYRVDNVGLTNLEGPSVDITGGESTISGNDTTITLDQDVFFSNTGASTFVYHIAHHLDQIQLPDSLVFVTYGEDAAGNEAAADAITVQLDFMQSEQGGYLCDGASGASLSVPAGALSRDAYVLLSVSDLPPAPASEPGVSLTASSWDEAHEPVGPLVNAGCAGVDLAAPVLIEIPYDPLLAANDLVGVYRAENGGWIYIGGELNAEIGLIRSYSWKFGQFQALAGPLGDITPEMPFSFKLDQNYPNPFNPSTRLQFELPFSQKVKLEIYNIQGERIAVLADGVYPAGNHVITWSPPQLGSGVYFLSLRADQGVLYRKMLYLK